MKNAIKYLAIATSMFILAGMGGKVVSAIENNTIITYAISSTDPEEADGK